VIYLFQNSQHFPTKIPTVVGCGN